MCLDYALLPGDEGLLVREGGRVDEGLRGKREGGARRFCSCFE